MPVRVAVVGAGYLGQHHARVYSELDEAKLVAVVDIDPGRAREVAGKYGAAAAASHLDVLKEVDALSIVVPTTHHHEVALDCIRAGKDLLVEKPITVTIEEAGALVREAKERERILQVGHLERYNPGVIALSHMVSSPRFIEATRVSPFLNRAGDVDVTLDLMIHDIDVILSLVSAPIRTMRAAGFSFVTDKIDEARAWIEFESGAVAVLTASRMAREKQRRLRVFQDQALFELDYQLTEIRRYRRPEQYTEVPEAAAGGLSLDVRSEPAPGYTVDTIRPEYMEPLKKELSDFLRCVATRERPMVSGEEGRDALKVALEINSLMR